ncbi:MAG: DUF4212 domain-containing protein [Pseudomonadales bacterium]
MVDNNTEDNTNSNSSERGLGKQYWRANLRILAVLLSIWFVVSYGFGILLVDWLDQFQLFGFKLGFWFAQQGAIYVFVLLILVYTILMRRLENRLGFSDD